MAVSIEPPRISHSKSTCRARFLDRCLAAMVIGALEALHQIGQLNRDFRSLSSLVAALATGAIHRLLHVVRREHSKGNRHACLKADLIQSVRHAASDKFEMRSISTNHGTHGNQSMALGRERLRRDSQ